ncbi:hypothetical protein RFI_13322 [Reticulomyxa filosa]|uniref:Uncharacterized protein n=1 Tax=Reticulomyxa filosa TaxID=46433 RepID=X6ND10_RETFI|nr:hypothetical protein RFI_13322 [Reticulomyxa filosa]|eukprot:ETO23846.1 hypothetical protein RFI_13322 [Reticulomyxa filosa]
MKNKSIQNLFLKSKSIELFISPFDITILLFMNSVSGSYGIHCQFVLSPFSKEHLKKFYLLNFLIMSDEELQRGERKPKEKNKRSREASIQDQDESGRRKFEYIRKEDRKTVRKEAEREKDGTNEPPNKKRKTISTEDQLELERLKDQNEKEEYESRLRKKKLEEKMATLKKENKWTEDQAEEVKRQTMLYKSNELREEADKNIMFGEARRISRQKYLKERVLKQTQLKERELQDNRTMFSKGELTEEEKKGMELDEIIYSNAKKSIEIREDDTKGGFYIAGESVDWNETPRIDKEKHAEILQKRYENDGIDRTDQVRQIWVFALKFFFAIFNYKLSPFFFFCFLYKKKKKQFWEEQRLEQAYQKNDGWEEKAEKEKETYEPLLQDQIVFIMDAMEKGKDLESELKEALESSEKTSLKQKEQTIAEQRKNLPIFKDKEKIIDALKQFQTLIVVAETGSFVYLFM